MEFTKSSLFMNTSTLLVIVGVIMGGVFGTISLLWWGMSQVGPDAARVWAIVATLIIFPAGAVGYRVGRHAVKERIAGLEDGISVVQQASSNVMQAAGDVADLRAAGVARIRNTVQQPEVVVELPPAEGSYKLLEAYDTSSNVIEME